jgi:hypothetical protein
MVTTSLEIETRELAWPAWGVGRNDVRVATAAATRQSETDYPTPVLLSKRKQQSTASYFLPETSPQILTLRESFNAMLPMTNVMAATVIG